LFQILCRFEVLEGSSLTIDDEATSLRWRLRAEANRLGIKSVKCFNGSRCLFEVLEGSLLAVVTEATSLGWRL